MAWTTPDPVIAGQLMTASFWNNQVQLNMVELRGGGIAIASQAANDMITGGGSTALARTAIGAARRFWRVNNAGNGLEWASWELPNAIGTAGYFLRSDGTIATFQPGGRLSTAASASSLTPDNNAFEIYEYTALAAGLTVNNMANPGPDGYRFFFRIKDNGTARSLSWGTSYQPGGVALPTTTVINKVLHLAFMYKAGVAHYLIGAAQEA